MLGLSHARMDKFQFSGADMRLLLSEFVPAMDAEPSAPYRHNEGYWMHMELKFVARALRAAAYRNYETALLLGHPRGVLNTCSAADNKAQLDAIDALLTETEEKEHTRIAATVDAGLPTPRTQRLAEVYKLNRCGEEVFQLLVLAFTGKSRAFRSQVSAYSSDICEMFADMCKISKLELENLFLDENKYVKDGVLLIDTSYTNEKSPRITREVATALSGGKLEMKDKLKLAGTEVLALVVQDEGGVLPQPDDADPAADSDLPPAAAITTTAAAVVVVNPLATAADTGTGAAAEGKRRQSFDPDAGGLDSELEALMSEEGTRVASSSQKAKLTSEASLDGLGDEDGKEQQPYTSSLDFLDDYFQQITEQIKLSRERLKREMKEVIGDDDVAPWEREGRGRRTNMREFEAKLRMIQTRIAHRLELTAQAGLSAPRLQMLCQRLQLDEFERKVVVLLIGHTVSPMMKEILDSLAQNGGLSGSRYGGAVEHVTVKLLLHTFCNTFQDQVANRVYFYKSSRLLRRGVIKMPSSQFTRVTEVDLMHQSVVLDRRILDWVVGLDTEISEIVEGSNLYKPTVNLEDVILEERQKKDILTAVTSFQQFKVYQKRHAAKNAAHFSESFARGLVLLFSGPSGTGKTMTANALATHLKMKVLLVNFNTMVESEKTRGGGSSLQSLFREADIHNAVLFFDECESLFAQRGRGGSHQLTELLTEIERHKGIIFLATNRPYDLDEAMHRRITSSFEFKPPNHLQRERIWDTHTAKAGVPLAGAIDWAEIAIRYELAGGYIKNAVLSALLLAIARDGPDNPSITQDDIVQGCAHQMRGTLKMKSFSDRIVPTAGMDMLVFPATTRQSLADVIELEKARGILFGQWGFGESMRAQQSTAVLLSGPNGCGKRSAAEAIGYETGRPLKVMNYSRLMASSSRSASEAEESVVKAVFKDASLMNAVVVLEGFEMELFGKEQGEHGASHLAMSELMHEIERYNGAVVLTVSTPSALSMYIHRLDPVFIRRLKFLIQFNLPGASEREQLWQRLIPEKVPREDGLDFAALAQRYELSGGQISKVAYRAAAIAALRPKESQILKQSDLVKAASMEEDKGNGEVSSMMQQCYA